MCINFNFTCTEQTNAYKFRSACNDNCTHTGYTHTHPHTHTPKMNCTQLYVNYQSVPCPSNCNFPFLFTSRSCSCHMLASILLLNNFNTIKYSMHMLFAFVLCVSMCNYVCVCEYECLISPT